MVRQVWIACALVAGLVGCASGPGEPAPPALRAFLSALEAQRLGAAYALTQLEEIAEAFGPGAAVTRKHFIASWEAHPLESYEITEIIRLQRRDIEDFGEGDPYFETMVRFSTEGGASWIANVGVEGEVVGTVVADVYPVWFAGLPPDAEIETSVDGIALDVRSDADGALSLLVLGGRHQVDIGGEGVVLDAEPLAIVDGDARVGEADPRTIRLNR